MLVDGTDRNSPEVNDIVTKVSKSDKSGHSWVLPTDGLGLKSDKSAKTARFRAKVTLFAGRNPGPGPLLPSPRRNRRENDHFCALLRCFTHFYAVLRHLCHLCSILGFPAGGTGPGLSSLYTTLGTLPWYTTYYPAQCTLP